MDDKNSRSIKSYVIGDFIAAFVAWLLFFIVRKTYVEHLDFDLNSYIYDKNFIVGGLILSAFWVYFYALTNTYYSVYEKSRINELIKTFIQTIIGSIILFLLFLLDDVIRSYRDYYYLIFFLITIHFIVTSFIRLTLLFIAKNKVKSGEVEFKTILLGNRSDIYKVYRELLSLKPLQGISISSLWTDVENKENESVDIPVYPMDLKAIKEEIKKNNYSLAILAFTKEEKDNISDYTIELDSYIKHIKVVSVFADILSSNKRIKSPIGNVLLNVNVDVMSPWQKIVKRTFDIVVSFIGILCAIPIYALTAICIKINSKGPILYKQKRIGKNEVPFEIYKFRSMYIDAEKHGPQLSAKEDSRITGVGRIIRKYRIDELPQFVNIFRGDMSFVGPRPERAFYAKQILDRRADYKYIYKVRPGATSWGVVYHGYADNLEKMVERVDFDLFYINNFSLLLDFRILLYTFITIIKGKGI
ncbi:MAG: exopolysaccharide biosynthesis polyprenyl glycosylphosphotransferase [Chitinophagales bacterium]|nr:exopolysaccharide biosynthesis polyprenyl glycosylphosphotransferase [Chitinophagales bacterium]